MNLFMVISFHASQIEMVHAIDFGGPDPFPDLDVLSATDFPLAGGADLFDFVDADGNFNRYAVRDLCGTKILKGSGNIGC